VLREIFQGYELTAVPRKTAVGKWSVAVRISGPENGTRVERTFAADEGIAYILEIEAERECLNLGRNLIRNNRIGFERA